MKIERISDNQIRCTLSKRDLNERHLKISELAYGSDKAKELFRDMMEQASIDFGFEADDIPLMIEAIPTSKESVILVITKVDDPEEFEEKFSRFGNLTHRFDEEDADAEFYEDEQDEDPEDDFEDDLINCFEQLNEIIESASDPDHENGEFIPLHEILKKDKRKRKSSEKSAGKPKANSSTRLYSFSSLDRVIDAAKAVQHVDSGKTSVWKDAEKGGYYLVMMKDNSNSFDQACSIIAEYGKRETITYATLDFFHEHYKLILKNDALANLAQL